MCPLRLAPSLVVSELEWRCAGWRPAMMGRLLIGVGELDHVSILVGPSEEGDAGRQVVAGKSRWDDNRGDEYQERIQMRGALLIDVGRIDSVTDQCRLVLDGLVDDGVQVVVCHDL